MIIKKVSINFLIINFFLFSFLFPSFAHGDEIGYYFPCSGAKAKAENRTIDISDDLKVNTIGMLITDIEDNYCVTRTKCIAMGFCKPNTPEEQGAADKLKAEIDRKNAEKAAKDAAEKAKIVEERNKLGLGSHRDSEADKFLAMKKAADAERNKFAKFDESQKAKELEDQRALQREDYIDNVIENVRSSEPIKNNKDKKDKEKDKLLPTPEAVLVCTKPTGKIGQFICFNPVGKMRGHLEDIVGYRTPEEMASRSTASCPELRKLASSTHFVWGCGFGATGFINAKYRGNGVDIQGRKNFYCKKEQQSCRRETPPNE